MDKPILNIKSLKEQVYEYLREQFRQHMIKPGENVDIDKLSKELGISRTPLRDALLQLEIEGFVTILPRRGIYVSMLTLQDVRDFYQIIGALEYAAIISSEKILKHENIENMEHLNEEMKTALTHDDFDLFYSKNLLFHNTYLLLSDNKTLIKIVNTLKKRLYDFPQPEKTIKEWEEYSTGEHDRLIALFKAGNFTEAANYIQNAHWSFSVHEAYIKKYYHFSD